MRRIAPFLLFLTLLISLALPASPALAAGPAPSPQPTVRVFYAGPAGEVRTALSLASNFQLVDDPAKADVLLLNGSIPDPAGLGKRLQDGARLVLALGPELTAEQLTTLLGTPVSITPASTPLSLNGASASADRLVKDIVWTSSPQVRDRYVLGGVTLDPLVEGFEDSSVVLGSAQFGKGQAFVFTAFLGPDTNPQIQSWAYFNYFIYNTVMRAAGQAPLSFADYPASPVPHATEQIILLSVMGAIILLSFLIFWFVRRYSLRHPELLDNLVSNMQNFAIHEARTQWEEVGFHRPLGGFLLALMLGLVMFIPLIIYQNLVLPVYILPSAQALGIWGRVTQFFNFAWTFFDMGTSIAFIKYMSEYRVHNPRKGVMFGQVFVWWQALSGAIQVAMVVILASTYAPHSAYAIYTWSVIIHAMIQIPGFYQVMRHMLTGMQRYDYAQILDMMSGLLLIIVVQPIIVAMMYAWGRSNPVMGGSMGGLLGMGVAAYVIEALTFMVGFFLYKRLGYNAELLFLAHFDWETVKNSFRFGVFEMLGSIAWAIGQAAEIWITQTRLINYAEIWGNWGLAQNFIYSYQVLSQLYNNAMPSISEAISHGRILLSQYYAVMSYKYGGIISAFIGSVLLAVADRFILGASGPEFVRAAAYSIPLIIWGAVQYPSWVGDNVQLATNRPYLKSALVTGEQIVRVGLAYLLLARLQINALIFAYFVGLLSKDIIAYFVNDRVCYRQRFYFWQSLIAPLLAGGVHYLWLRLVTGFIWQGDQITSVLIFLIGILVSFPVFTFLYGLFGGWDDDTLHELRMAADLSSFMRPMSWLFWASTALGARISPLHGRFPITIRTQALEEAKSLTCERVSLETV